MSIGTFDAFTSARLGIYAAQHGLNVTGNNISNINTVGYTRQRLDQVSFKAGAYDRYRSQMDNHVGSGALVMGINQVRDPYLDVRFRNTNAEVGYEDRMLAGLQEVADILDEVTKGENASDNEKGDGLLHAQIQDLSDKLRAFGKEPTKANNDLVRTSAENLCALFNKYANKLETLYQDTKKDFGDQVTQINECLTNIRDLNREIRNNEIYGDNALELRDERNRQIDTLSQYLHIKVIYSEEDIGCGQKVEKLSIYLDDDNPDINVQTDGSMLIDGVFGAQLYETPKPNPKFDKNQPVSAANAPYLDKDGNPVEDVKDAALKDPDNYFLSISKLLDVKDREWTRISSSGPVEMTGNDFTTYGGKNPEKAVYKYTLTSTANTPGNVLWNENSTIEIGGNTFTVGEDGLSLEIVQDSEKLAKFIASKLNGTDPDYVITAEGKDIVYTAKKYGKVGGQGPKAEPGLTLTPNAGKLTLGGGQETSTGVDSEEPKIPNGTENPKIDPATGKETLITFQLNNGKWCKTTTGTEHTFEVDLDDNDLYGSLQATRELLTEKGEFAKQSTVNDIDENAAKKRGIPYYQMSLDLLAQKFAEEYNNLNVGDYKDQNGNDLPATMTVDAIKVENGKVWAIDTATGKYKQTDWTQDKNGYCVDSKGFYTGIHEDAAGTGCIITGKIPANGTSQEILNGLAAAYNGDAAMTAKITAAQDLLNKNDPAAADEVEKILKECLNDHGVKPGDKETVPYDKGELPQGGPLFSNRNDNDDPNNITAANISVSHSWSTGSVQLVPTWTVLFPDDGSLPHTTQNDNAGHMLNMIEKELLYNPKDLDPDAVSDKLFTGNFNDMFSNMNTICGQDIRASKIGLDTSYTQLVEIDTSRDGVSGVDLNDEAMNMMQFQKALNASMRLMTVIDEALDRLINNTGVAGR